MPSKWPKVICDPVHRFIPFEDNTTDKLLLSLINTREFQRLRRIKQLGMSELVFPGANHSRFAHSIGVLHMARNFLNRLQAVSERPLDDEKRRVVLCAALLHDVGHGPFSHAFEKVTKENHEKWTEKLILDPYTEINERLTEVSPDLPAQIRLFYDSESQDVPDGNQGIPAYLSQVVSSQLDADRFDYLLRDSYSCGTTDGAFEYEYLIYNLHLDETYNRLFIGRKAVIATEAYVFARYRMYQNVYFHKTTRAAEVMLKLLFSRLNRLINDHGSTAVENVLVSGAPPRLVAAFTGDISLSDYLALDDVTVTEFIKAGAESSDQPLQELSRGILNRQLYKATDGTDLQRHKRQDFVEKARALLKENGFDPEVHFVEDSASNVPYKPYDPSAEHAASEILVEDASGNIVEITQACPPLRPLTQKLTLVRYYYPEPARALIAPLIRS